jgi:hypothetical protein
VNTITGEQTFTAQWEHNLASGGGGSRTGNATIVSPGTGNATTHPPLPPVLPEPPAIGYGIQDAPLMTILPFLLAIAIFVFIRRQEVQ